MLKPEINSIRHGAMDPLDRAAGTAAYQSAQRLRPNGQRPSDTVEISNHARLLERIRNQPDVRVDLVERVRQAILDGTYESDDKLDVAVERMLEDL